MSVASNSASQLNQIFDALKNLSTRYEAELAVFSDKGQLRSYSESLGELLESKPSDSLFSNGSKKLRFFDENQNAISPAALPWKSELAEEEIFEPRLILHAEKNKEEKWVSCLVTKLRSFGSAAAPSSERVASFADVSQLVRDEKRLSIACKSLQVELKELDTAVSEIEQLKSRIKRANDKVDIESFAPRTHERPPAELETVEVENQNKRVLVVDDIAINQKLLAKRLQKLNMECDFASNGQQGVDMALSGKYGLVFMDCDMPVMDGFEATQTIRKAELETGRHVPIIALTSYDRDDDRERCLSSGMDEYLSKGASPNLLQEVVEWCLRRNKAKEEHSFDVGDFQEELDITGLSETFSKDELNEIFELFLPSTNTLMRCLRMSMDERDVRSIGHFAYSLKGPFASLGMLMTSKLTSRLTEAAEEKQWEEANDYYEMLARNCEAMRNQLEERASKLN